MDNLHHIKKIEELASSEGGVFTSGQAGRQGIPLYALSYAHRAGRIERVAHGAYRLSSSISDGLDTLRAAYKLTAPRVFTYERMGSGFDGVAARGASAAYVLEVGDIRPRPWDLAVRQRFNSRMKDVRFRVEYLERQDVTWESGLPVTRPERTIADLLRDDWDVSLVCDVFIDAVKKYGATSFDMRYLQELLGTAGMEALLSASGLCDDGPYQLIALDNGGHVAISEAR